MCEVRLRLTVVVAMMGPTISAKESIFQGDGTCSTRRNLKVRLFISCPNRGTVNASVSILG